MKATANGGTVISCARVAVYPKPWTIEGVKLMNDVNLCCPEVSMKDLLGECKRYHP